MLDKMSAVILTGGGSCAYKKIIVSINSGLVLLLSEFALKLYNYNFTSCCYELLRFFKILLMVKL